MLAASPFLGEGHRKVWARLRAQGIRTSKPRVLRLMRQADLLAPSRVPRVVGPRVHDGTITPERPNQMWGTDATSTVTVADGAVTVFIGVDHCTLEGIGIHAAKRATRFEALERDVAGCASSSAPSPRASQRACRCDMITAVNI